MRKFPLLLLLSLLMVGLYGCSTTSTAESRVPFDLTEDDAKTIQTYLNEEVEPIPEDGELISVFNVFESDKNSGKIYLYAHISGGGELGAPFVLYAKEKNGQLIITKHKTPREGIYWGKDSGKLFPDDIRDKLSNYDTQKINEDFKETYPNLQSLN
ncbi:hypothetical protein [Jeotgalibacillus proteolyticus]|uniref:Lipoprotein n=1 Tax=Jeotgalibacillus proteolyticus TaxID=2082395 RepID=A0A2S5G634_9BACL|nr:hypothetical protein [Jeotgalibacillus proteolyticus]PPA68450.1 hypothetical protein C4B60_21025 [Jeotgalibacillus proteolyticus]